MCIEPYLSHKTIGLRGEEAVSNFEKKRFRPVLEEKNIFFKFFSGFKRAKLNKNLIKKIFFRSQIFEKKIKFWLILGQKHLILVFFSICSVFFEFFDWSP